MIKYVVAAFIAFGAMLGVSAQAAPVTSPSTTLQAQVTQDEAVQKVWHCRRWSGGWGCGRRWGWGWHGRWRSHHRWGSRRW
jgi:hypothetical protein